MIVILDLNLLVMSDIIRLMSIKNRFFLPNLQGHWNSGT